MRVKDYLQAANQRLEAAGIGTARLDVLVLLEDVLNTNRTQLLAHPEMEITEADTKKLDKLIAKRAQHVPLAYLRGKTEFYGREFIVNEDVLEPRPESETMIDLLKELRKGPSFAQGVVIDVGTGSGALAITAKLELPDAEVTAIDIDKNCLKVARQNATKLGADVNFLQSDLLEPLSTFDFRLSTLLCNLPYVPDNFQLNTAALHEPRLAIFGGPDGLDLYRRLFAQINSMPSKPKYVLAESMPPQHSELATIAVSAGYQLAQTSDFIQIYRNE